MVIGKGENGAGLGPHFLKAVCLSSEKCLGTQQVKRQLTAIPGWWDYE